MRHIYEDSAAVYVWLGDPTTTEVAAIEYLPDCVRHLLNLNIDAHQSLSAAFTIAGLPEPSSDIWKAYTTLMSRAWWSRLWTLQEVVMAPDLEGAVAYQDFYQAPAVHVLCGDTTTMWEQFDKFVGALAKNGLKEWLITDTMGVTSKHLHGIDAIAEVRTARASVLRYGWAVSPSAALVATHQRLATVPVDYVFGQLAMFDRDTIQQLALDISMSMREVFTRFAKHYIRNEVKECLLNHNATIAKLPELPTWCPNFASQPETQSIGSRWLGHYQEETWVKKQMPCAGFQKEGKWKLPRSRWYYARAFTNAFKARHKLHNQYNTKNPRQIAIVPDADCILAKGVELDTVTGIIECNPGFESADFFTHNSIVHTLAWDQACFALAQRYLRIPKTTTSNSGSYYETYARTIVANRRTMRLPYSRLDDVLLEDHSDILDDEVGETDIIFDRHERLSFAPAYLEWRKFMQATLAAGKTISAQANRDAAARGYAACLATYGRRRRFFATKGGKIGMGPSNAQVGDKVAVIFYCPTPYLLRPSNAHEGQWEFIGEAFVKGYMYGEALEMFDLREVDETQWVIC